MEWVSCGRQWKLTSLTNSVLGALIYLLYFHNFLRNFHSVYKYSVQMLRIRILVNWEVPKFVARLLLFFDYRVRGRTNKYQSIAAFWFQCFLTTLSQHEEFSASFSHTRASQLCASGWSRCFTFSVWNGVSISFISFGLKKGYGWYKLQLLRSEMVVKVLFPAWDKIAISKDRKGIELVNSGPEMGCLGGILVHSSVG